MKVKALEYVHDIKTDVLYTPGDEWELDRPREVIDELVRGKVIEIVEDDQEVSDGIDR
jgi:hypothetical protein